MSANGYLQLIFYVVVLLALAKPLGIYMANIYEGKPALLNRIGAPLTIMTSPWRSSRTRFDIRCLSWSRLCCA